MEDVTMETTVESQESCPTCAKVAHEAKANEEISLAFLLALVPMITLTFFGQIGLL